MIPRTPSSPSCQSGVLEAVWRIPGCPMCQRTACACDCHRPGAQLLPPAAERPPRSRRQPRLCLLDNPWSAMRADSTEGKGKRWLLAGSSSCQRECVRRSSGTRQISMRQPKPAPGAGTPAAACEQARPGRALVSRDAQVRAGLGSGLRR
eukprot:scaffold3_cov389-Prasinococcus_capsulatus_cf.AAC.18